MNVYSNSQKVNTMRLNELKHARRTAKIDALRESLNGVGGYHSFDIQIGDQKIERYVFMKSGRKVGADFDGDEFLGLYNLNSQYHRTTALTEGAFGKFLGTEKAPLQRQQTSPKQPEKVIPKSDSAAKDILSGTEVFKDAERKIRLFLRGAKGSGSKNIFVLAGMPGVGKSVAAKAALTTECGPEISPDQALAKLKEMSFDTADFSIRLKARDSVEQARQLYQRFLHNYKLSAGARSDEQEMRKRALQSVQQQMEKRLYGYQLSIEDMEGSGALNKSASDVLMKLKKLGGEGQGVKHDPSNGWMEVPAELSNKEFYLELYQGNSKTLFVDEGDYFLVTDNPLMKTAFATGPFRRVTVGKKGYVEVHGRIIPDEIICSTKMVITTNVPKEKWNGAVRSRATTYFFYLTIDQLFSRLSEILPGIKERELPHLPMILLIGMRNTLKNFAKKGELHTFDYRVFVELCDEFALMLEDEIQTELHDFPQEKRPSVYKMNDEYLKSFKENELGRRIWARASNKFKKTLLNQIQQMNRAKPEDQNVIQFTDDEDTVPVGPYSPN